MSYQPGHYHLHGGILTKSKGHSALKASMYIAEENSRNQTTGEVVRYSRKNSRVAYKEVMLPSHAPSTFKSRDVLWNEVERVEKSKNAQLARSLNMTFENGISQERRISILREYVQSNFVDQGMCADIAIHHGDEDHNPHAHVLLTMRSLDENGNWQAKHRKEYLLDAAGNKQYDKQKRTYKYKRIGITDWDNRENMETWRANWARVQNQELARINSAKRVDHRSYFRQNSGFIPTIHEGHKVTQLKSKGFLTDRAMINEEIQRQNMQYTKEIQEMEKRLTEKNDENFVRLAKSLGVTLSDLGKSQVEPQTASPSDSNFVLYDLMTGVSPQSLANDSESASSTPAEVIPPMRKPEEIRADYMALADNQHQASVKVKQLSRQKRTIEGKINDLQRSQALIEELMRDEYDVAERRKNLNGLDWDERREIDKKTRHIERTKENNLTILMTEYSINPEGIASLLAKLEQEKQAVDQSLSQLPDLEKMRSRAAILENEYKQSIAMSGGSREFTSTLDSAQLQKMGNQHRSALKTAERKLEELHRQAGRGGQEKEKTRTVGFTR